MTKKKSTKKKTGSAGKKGGAKKAAPKKPGSKSGKGSLYFALKSSIGGSSIDDIVQGIKKDHADLKKFISVLKDEKAGLPEKREAFAGFSELLDSHAKSEEKALYSKCLKNTELKPTAQEGYVEHEVAALLLRSIKKTTERGLWTAQAKVLAEMVEHHIEEEESEMLPEVSKQFSKDKKAEMEEEFVGLRLRTQSEVTEENAGVLKEA